MGNYKKLGFFMLFTNISVLFLIGLSMYFYPEPYSWPKQFLSALGLTRLPNGTSNPVSSLLFNSALFLAGSGTILYFLVRSREFKRPLPRRVMETLGMIGGIALLGIGLIPYDVHPDLHNWSTYISQAIGAAILLTLFQDDSPFGLRQENILWCIFGLFVVTLWGCLYYLTFHAKMLPVRPAAPFMQKMIIGFFLCYMFYHTAVLLLRTRKSP